MEEKESEREPKKRGKNISTFFSSISNKSYSILCRIEKLNRSISWAWIYLVWARSTRQGLVAFIFFEKKNKYIRFVMPCLYNGKAIYRIESLRNGLSNEKHWNRLLACTVLCVTKQRSAVSRKRTKHSEGSHYLTIPKMKIK